MPAAPPVVLLSGLAGNWFDWDQCAAALSPRRTVVRLDRPGYGLSDPLPRGALPTLTGEVRRLVELLDHLGVSRAVVAAHSMGSFYAEAFARLHPDRVAALVLLDGSVERTGRPVLPEPWRSRLVLAVTDGAVGLGLARMAPPVHRALVHSTPPGGYTARQRAWKRRVLASDHYLRAAIEENAQYPVLARQLVALRLRAPMPTVPVTIAVAHTGRPTPWGGHWVRSGRRIAARAGARFEVVSPASHHLMIDQPRRVARIIDEAMDQPRT